MEYPHRIHECGVVAGNTADQSRSASSKKTLIGIAVQIATIPWQSAQPQVSVVAIDPGGTACPPVHRNGA
jgi:hypothetical protein